MFPVSSRYRCALVALTLLFSAAEALAPRTAWLCAQEPTSQPSEPSSRDASQPSDAASTAEAPLETAPETTVVGQPQTANQPQQPQPSQAPGNPTVITPTRIPTPASQTGSSLTVITRDQIEQSQRTYVVDVLRQTPGLDVVQSGTPGGVTSVFLRGANSQHTKVLLDGIPLNDPSNATRLFDFSTLTTDNVEQIEIVRGPQSLLYGSDAIGGVINIITRRGEGPLSVRASMMGGSYGTRQPKTHISGGNDLLHYAFGASYFENDGFSQAARRLGNLESDATRNATFSGRFGITPSELFDVEYIFRWVDAAAEVDDVDFVTSLPFDNFYRVNHSDAFYQRVQAQSLLLDGAVDNRVGFSLSDYDRFDTDSGPFLDPLFQGQTRKFDMQTNLRLTEWNTFSVGADYFEEDALSTSVPMESQNDAGFYVQDTISLGDRWFTTVGHRWDDHSAAGHAETYRATTLYRLLETGTVFRASIGTGFRAPSLAENFFPFGNQNLRPETSKGWDYGIEQSLFEERLVLGATYFRNDFTNLIIFDPTTFILDNIGQALATGVEISALYRLDPCTEITLAVTHTDTQDRDTGLRLLRRPRDKASLTISRRLMCDRARANLYLLYVSDRRDTNFVLDDYFLVNASGTFDWNDHVQLFTRIDNLTDTDYEEVAGFGVAGASAYGGVNLLW
jgi:vitamin B12 transporter